MCRCHHANLKKKNFVYNELTKRYDCCACKSSVSKKEYKSIR